MTETTQKANIAETTQKAENLNPAPETENANSAATEYSAEKIAAYAALVKGSVESMKPDMLYPTAEKLCGLYNEARYESDIAVMSKLKDALDDVMKAYVTDCRIKCFTELKASDDPILSACRQMYYPCHKVVDKPMSKEDSNPVMRLEPTRRQIDLLKLHKFLGNVSGKDANWVWMLQALNKKLTARIIVGTTNPDNKDALKERLAKLDDSYLMGEIRKEFLAGKTPTSNSQIQKELQKVVIAMVGEGFKVLTHDVTYLVEGYAGIDKRTRALKVSNHAGLASIVQMVIHRIDEGAPYYKVLYDMKK